MLKFILAAFIIYLNISLFVFGHEIGDQCIDERTQSSGVCKYLRQCNVAREDTNKGFKPTTCFYDRRKPVVCCRNPTEVIETTTSIPTASGAISKRKCEEYANKTLFHTHQIGISSKKIVEKLIYHCPLDEGRIIIGGTDAVSREFPHMALLGYAPENLEISWQCAGSLISERFVVTAAHCLYFDYVHPVKKVMLGALDITAEDDENIIIVSVERRIKHPAYSQITYNNDIGLLELSNSVVFTEFIRPACLPYTANDDLIEGLITGWGSNHWSSNKMRTILQKAKLNIFPKEECVSSSTVSRHTFIHETTFCAGDKINSVDICTGDSGGPFQIRNNQPNCTYLIIGISSRNEEICGTIGAPSIFTKVYGYIEWIESNVWPEV